jgi:hypothetical protein
LPPVPRAVARGFYGGARFALEVRATAAGSSGLNKLPESEIPERVTIATVFSRRE